VAGLRVSKGTRKDLIGAEGAGRLAGALGECKALSHLDLSENGIGDEGAGRLAGELGECKTPSRLVLSTVHSQEQV